MRAARAGGGAGLTWRAPPPPGEEAMLVHSRRSSAVPAGFDSRLALFGSPWLARQFPARCSAQTPQLLGLRPPQTPPRPVLSGRVAGRAPGGGVVQVKEAVQRQTAADGGFLHQAQGAPLCPRNAQ
ncbi:hypothetical protein NDU88_010879 [Pleurodeles waltl]|uniref:Uncharacterized protein n=1 Tax=Pleurodeles waltl TaxID=8319 RepID=A0AAV7QZJ1_PLEWA|nr:hypothetical protein NDU88_010879 [Pleurodeles waltl]